jgi:alpha-tubulin suppressor-like RCC1 family protein
MQSLGKVRTTAITSAVIALSLAGAMGAARAQAVPLADVVQIASGWAHTCAIVGAGAVKCWGTNFNGALGDGTTSDRSTPDMEGTS